MSLDWEIYAPDRERPRPDLYRALLFRDVDPTLLATVESRWKWLLYLRMVMIQWRFR